MSYFTASLEDITNSSSQHTSDKARDSSRDLVELQVDHHYSATGFST